MNSVPMRQERCVVLDVDGFDLLAQTSDGPPPDPLQDIRIAVFEAVSSGSELPPQ